MNVLAPVATTIYEGPDAETRLRALGGLSVALLDDVVRQGEYARAEQTQHDPLAAGGWDAFRYRVRAFRDLTAPLGWRVFRERGLEITRSPCSRHAVITRGGDSGVGRRDAHPQPAGRVGETTCDAIDENSSLLFDANWMNEQARNDTQQEADGCQTWMLLVHRQGDIARAELSLPRRVEETDNGTRVLAWAERVLLPDLDLSNEPVKGSRSEPETPIAVEPTVVRRR